MTSPIAIHPKKEYMRSIIACLLFLLSRNVFAQTSVILSPAPVFYSVTQNGSPNGFGCVFTYISGTTSNLTTYTDATGTTQNPNPVVLSANGTANIWIKTGSTYSYVVKTAGGVNCVSGSTIYTVRGISGGSSQLVTPVTYSATPNFQLTAQNELFTMTLSGDASALPITSVGVSSPSYVIFQITQDGTGGHTFTWPSNSVGGCTIASAGSSTSTQEFIWDGSTAWSIGPCITGNGPATSSGSITATTSVTTPSLTLNGTTMSNGPGTYVVETNSASPGTILFGLAGFRALSGTVSRTDAGQTSGVLGIVIAGAGTAGVATIQRTGKVNCNFDGSTVAGDYVQISASVIGDCTDVGQFYPLNGQVIGRVINGHSGAGLYTVELFGPEIHGGNYTLCSLQPLVGVVANTTSDVILNSCSFPSGTLNFLGKTFRLTMQAAALPGTSSTATIKWGAGTSSSLGANTALVSKAAGTNSISSAESITCTVTATGVTGVLTCSYQSNPISSDSSTISSSGSNTTVDLTGTVFVGAACQYGTANVSNTCNQAQLVLEQLN